MASKSMVCPNCSAPIQTPPDSPARVCSYCGSVFSTESPNPIGQPTPSASSNAIENLNNLGFLEIKSGNFQEARSHFSRVLEMDLENANAWFGKGASALGNWKRTDQEQDQQESLFCFEKAIKYSTDPESMMFLVVTAFEAGKLMLGTKNLFAFAEKYPENSAAWLYRERYSEYSSALMFENAIRYSKDKSRVKKEVVDRLVEGLKEWSESESLKDIIDDVEKTDPNWLEENKMDIVREGTDIQNMIDLLIRIDPESIPQEERRRYLNRLSAEKEILAEAGKKTDKVVRGVVDGDARAGPAGQSPISQPQSVTATFQGPSSKTVFRGFLATVGCVIFPFIAAPYLWISKKSTLTVRVAVTLWAAIVVGMVSMINNTPNGSSPVAPRTNAAIGKKGGTDGGESRLVTGRVNRENAPFYSSPSTRLRPIASLRSAEPITLLDTYGGAVWKVRDRLGVVTERMEFSDRSSGASRGVLKKGDLVDITGTIESDGLSSIECTLGKDLYVPIGKVRRTGKKFMYHIKRSDGTEGYVLEDCLIINAAPPS